MQHLDDSARPSTATTPASRAAAPASGRHVAVLGHFHAPNSYAVHRPDGGRSWLIAWTIGGAGRFGHGTTTVTATPRTLIVAAPSRAIAQSYATVDAPWHFWWMHVRLRPTWTPLVTPWTVGDGLMVTSIAGDGDADRVTAAFARARRDVVGTSAPSSDDGPDAIWVSSDTSTDLVLNALEEVLLVAARSPASATADPAATSEVGLDTVRRRISADPAAAHTVSSLAAIAAMSPSHFAHRFRQRFGQSPMAAVREERLDLAAALLRGTGLSVGEVARAVGYRDPFYFSRLFHRYRGASPSAYAAANPEINNT